VEEPDAHRPVLRFWTGLAPWCSQPAQLLVDRVTSAGKQIKDPEVSAFIGNVLPWSAITC